MHSFLQRNILERKWLATIRDVSREYGALLFGIQMKYRVVTLL
jgi:hypothetical protein